MGADTVMPCQSGGWDSEPMLRCLIASQGGTSMVERPLWIATCNSCRSLLSGHLSSFLPRSRAGRLAEQRVHTSFAVTPNAEHLRQASALRRPQIGHSE